MPGPSDLGQLGTEAESDILVSVLIPVPVLYLEGVIEGVTNI